MPKLYTTILECKHFCLKLFEKVDSETGRASYKKGWVIFAAL